MKWMKKKHEIRHNIKTNNIKCMNVSVWKQLSEAFKLASKGKSLAWKILKSIHVRDIR